MSCLTSGRGLLKAISHNTMGAAVAQLKYLTQTTQNCEIPDTDNNKTVKYLTQTAQNCEIPDTDNNKTVKYLTQTTQNCEIPDTDSHTEL